MKGIIGAIAGDIIGSTHEFRPIKTKEFSLFNKRSRFTDDTIMTLAVAKWLINDKDSKDELVDQLQYFGNAYIDQVRQALVFPHREYVNTGSKNSANGVQSENTEVVVCKNCGGNNTILVGQVCECEFCGSPISISKKK